MINRDAAPFIFTDDFLYIIGGKEGKKSKNWDEFQDLCCTCYNILRKHADLFINLSATCPLARAHSSLINQRAAAGSPS